MRAFLTLVLVGLVGRSVAQPPPGYYDSAAGLTGPALKNALYEIISPHTVSTNAQLWSDFMTTDDREDVANTVWDIYSDDPSGAEAYLFTFGTDQCGSYDEEGDCYNREHTVPQSWFDSALPMVTDLFHVYPTDGWVNLKRGDLPYGLVGSTDFISDNGTKTGNSITPGYGGTVCEPIDAYKGDIARNYFYMATRYQPLIASWSGDMFFGDDLSPWTETLLLSWHIADPVSQKEFDRNNAVFAIQANRNPYIDHPEWVHSIWGPTAAVHERIFQGEKVWFDGHDLRRSAGVHPWPLAVVDATGRMVISTTWADGSITLPAALPPGHYVARLPGGCLPFVR